MKKRGLNRGEWERRFKEDGPNTVASGKKESIFSIFFNQFKDFMILILLIAALLSAIMGHGEDALVILAILVINSFLGLIQEYRAERSLRL